MSGYRIDLYFHDNNLVIEIDENGLSDRNIAYEIKRKKTIEKELGCKFISTDPDKEDFDIFRTINEIFRQIKQSTKKVPRSKILARLLVIEFKSDNIIKSKAIKYICEKILPDYN